jgi:uncharacterized protein (TIGR02466 family)
MRSQDLYASTIHLHEVRDKAYIKKCLELVKTTAGANLESNSCSVRNGWQSSKVLYKLPDFARLADHVLHLADTLLAHNTLRPFISAMWLNVHGQGGFNHVHVHTTSWYSGVFYLQCSEKSGNITFTDPRPGADMSYYHQLTQGRLHTITPSAGDLILFPGFLPHLVEPNCSQEPRISVSFNIELDHVRNKNN